MSEKPPARPSPSGNLPFVVSKELPAIIHRAGANAVFAAQEFFFGTPLSWPGPEVPNWLQ